MKNQICAVSEDAGFLNKGRSSAGLDLVSYQTPRSELQDPDKPATCVVAELKGDGAAQAG